MIKTRRVSDGRLEFYSQAEIEDMDLQDFEAIGKSDFELIEELASVRMIFEIQKNPYFEVQLRAIMN